MRTHLVRREDLSELVDRIMSEPDAPLGLDTETTGLSIVDDVIVGVGLSCGNRHGVYLPFRHRQVLEKEPVLGPPNRKGEQKPLRLGKDREQWRVVRAEDHPDNLTKDELDLVFRAIHESRRRVVLHNAAFDLEMLAKEGWVIDNEVADTMVARWLLYRGLLPNGRGRLGLKKLAKTDLGVKMTEYEEVDTQGLGFQHADLEFASEYGADDPKRTLQLWSRYEKQLLELKEEFGDDFMREFMVLEMPVARIVGHMQSTGVHLDVEHLKRCDEQLRTEQVEILAKLAEIVQGEFPITSTQKVSRMMFDHLRWWNAKGLERGKARKEGEDGFYSTAEEVLVRQLHIANERGKKVALLMLRWRKLEALRARYCMSLAEKVDRDGRLRASFHQVGTDTGRFSSSGPNLQNIPRLADDKHPDVWVRHLPPIRNAFVAAPGRKLVDIDFSQIELRFMAHFSQDETLLRAYREDLDIHQLTADEVGCSRQDAKPINFGLIYGMSAWKLAKVLSCSEEQAAKFHDRYFNAYPGVLRYHKRTELWVKDHGYVKTITGRHRRIEHLDPKDWGAYNHSLRQAYNTKIQGSAADLMKIAMRNLYLRMLKEGLLGTKFWMVSTVHDELLCEVVDGFEEEAAAIMKYEFENAVTISVPIKADPKVGIRWGEIH